MSLTVKYRFPARMATRAPGMANVASMAAGLTTSPTRPMASRLARQLALAYHVERLIEKGVLKDYAEAARLLGLTRARMTQIVNLRWLSPKLQEAILEGTIMVAERVLRRAACEAVWERQMEH